MRNGKKPHLGQNLLSRHLFRAKAAIAKNISFHPIKKSRGGSEKQATTYLKSSVHRGESP